MSLVSRALESALKDHLNSVKEDTHRRGDGIGMFTHKHDTTFGYYFIKRSSRLWASLNVEHNLETKYDSSKAVICIGIHIPKNDTYSREEYLFHFEEVSSPETEVPETTATDDDNDDNDTEQ